MIIPRDVDNQDSPYVYYNPWGNWGRWVLLAVIVIIILACIASFVVRRKQYPIVHPVPAQDIPLGPVYPMDPQMQPGFVPPPKYQPEGNAYTGPVYHGPQQQTFAEKGYASSYGPPPGPPPPPSVAYSSLDPNATGSGSGSGSGTGSSPSASDYYGPPLGPPPRHF